jgi:hypothetical protein
MAQARLLTIYKVEGEHSISSLPSYRIENRSKDLLFDVTVPCVDSPNGLDAEVERRTADLVAQDNRFHEFIPTAEQLTPYRDHIDYEACSPSSPSIPLTRAASSSLSNTPMPEVGGGTKISAE